jgi:transposase
VYRDMEQWNEIRQRVLVDGESQRSVQRQTGMHWKTLKKILQHGEPPGYRREAPRARPKLGPFVGTIRQILEDDKAAPAKQRHTAKRIFQRIKAAGYSGGYTQVKEVVAELRQHSQEVFVPLLTCSPKTDPDVMRVLRPKEGRRDFHETEETQSGADHR